MTDDRNAETPRRGDLPAEIDRDLAQWREATTRDVPALHHAVARVRLERGADSPWRTRYMNATEPARRHPWLLTAGVAALVVVGLLVVPISYTRTVGTRVTLTLESVKNPAAIPAIAKEMKSALGANGVRVEADAASGEPVYSFVANVPKAKGANPAPVAAAFAKELTARGYSAKVGTEPITEKVSGSVYAFARDVVIKVDIADKSPAQIENEIRQQLAAAGITDAQVSVTEATPNTQKVTMEMRQQATSGGSEQPTGVKLDLTKNGQPLDLSKGSTVDMRMLKSSDGGKTIQLNIGHDGQTTTIEIPHVESMSDAQLSSEVTSRLQAAGITNLRVTVNGGQLSVERTP